MHRGMLSGGSERAASSWLGAEPWGPERGGLPPGVLHAGRGVPGVLRLHIYILVLHSSLMYVLDLGPVCIYIYIVTSGCLSTCVWIPTEQSQYHTYILYALPQTFGPSLHVHVCSLPVSIASPCSFSVQSSRRVDFRVGMTIALATWADCLLGVPVDTTRVLDR